MFDKSIALAPSERPSENSISPALHPSFPQSPSEPPRFYLSLNSEDKCSPLPAHCEHSVVSLGSSMLTDSKSELVPEPVCNALLSEEATAGVLASSSDTDEELQLAIASSLSDSTKQGHSSAACSSLAAAAGPDCSYLEIGSAQFSSPTFELDQTPTAGENP